LSFAEGESELVSGFNIEYVAGGVALFFLAEYASILFIRLLFCVIFLGSDLDSLFFLYQAIFYLLLVYLGAWNFTPLPL
jgi:NADH-ubiquinone oxidoreductase chain 1